MAHEAEWLTDLPKADLHVHVDGSVRTATILDLARIQGVRLPTDDPQALETLVTVGPGCRSLAQFLKTFDVFYPLLKNPEALERVAAELVEDEAADGVRYVEARFAPALQATDGFTIHGAVEAVLRGLRAGARRTGALTGLVLCCYRSEDPSTSAETVEAALRLRGDGVVGLDLAGDERTFPALPHLPSFVRARDAGLPVTIHAGEEGPPANIQEAVFLLGARRLGHAVRLADDPELLRWVAGEGIAVEVCLTSNVLTGMVAGYGAHPLPAFLEAGVTVALNTDDPAVFGTTLTREFALAGEHFGLDRAALTALARAGFASAFLPDDEKNLLLRRFEDWRHEREG